MEDSEIVMIPKEEFTELINKSPQAAQKFIKILAKNIADKEQQLLGLAYNSLRKRVAEALLSMHRKYKTNDADQFAIQLSREDLANIAGTATESLIRTLSDFKSEKLVEIKDGAVVICDEQKLASLIS
jgi:CRP-like cAMP-binding protein